MKDWQPIPWWTSIGMMVLAYLLQITWLPRYLPTAAPDLLLVLVLLTALLHERNWSLYFLAGVAGLALDITHGRFLGFNLLLFLVAALVAVVWDEAFTRTNAVFAALMAAALSLPVEVLRGIMARVTGASFGGVPGVASVLFPVALFNGLAMFLLFSVFARPVTDRWAFQQKRSGW